MKNKDIKNLLKSEYENIKVPPISSRVTEVPIQGKPPIVSNNYNRRPVLKLVFTVVVCVALILVALIPTLNSQSIVPSELTSYILEINPTICITADSSDNIVAICSLSSDGDILLSDNRFESVVGATLDNGLKSVIDASVDLGYFENYSRRIVLFAINNKESFAFEKTKNFEKVLSRHLQEHNLEEINIDKGCMSISDFKNRMEFNNNFNDLDKMRDDIQNRPMFFDENFTLPPPLNFYY